LSWRVVAAVLRISTVLRATAVLRATTDVDVRITTDGNLPLCHCAFSLASSSERLSIAVASFETALESSRLEYSLVT
jgi:hypothetical protein